MYVNMRLKIYIPKSHKLFNIQDVEIGYEAQYLNIFFNCKKQDEYYIENSEAIFINSKGEEIFRTDRCRLVQRFYDIPYMSHIKKARFEVRMPEFSTYGAMSRIFLEKKLNLLPKFSKPKFIPQEICIANQKKRWLAHCKQVGEQTFFRLRYLNRGFYFYMLPKKLVYKNISLDKTEILSPSIESKAPT